MSSHKTALQIIQLLNNNKYIFGSNRRPIVQFSIENRRALQLKEERRERLRAKQDFLKNPTDKTLSFESNRKKKKRWINLLEEKNNKIRLSEIIKQQRTIEESSDVQDDNENNMSVDDNEMIFNNNSNIENKKKKKQRSRTKSKGEIRDELDRIIAKSRNKPQLPQRTKKKWFE